MAADRLRTALAVLAVDPAAVGGLWLRARASPLRIAVTEALADLPLPVPLRRLPPGTGDEALFGGLDMAATLKGGRPVLRGGLLDSPALFLLPMAERSAPGLAARLAQALDRRGHALVALDEAAEPGEGLAAPLVDRLGLFLDLGGLRAEAAEGLLPDPARVAAARARLAAVKIPHETVRQVVLACERLGIDSLRAPMLALSVARVLAALAGRGVVEEPDVLQAGELALAHRAVPAAEPQDVPPPPQPPPPPPEGEGTETGGGALPEEILVDAVRAALPPDVLAGLAEIRATRSARGATGSGTARAGRAHGAPLPARRGSPRDADRLDLVATLRAAAPWQGVRRAAAPDRAGLALLVAPGDLHLRCRAERADRVLVLAVDASGSAAVARLAEAKGAVELLLAEAYSRRDHVALLTFRGRGASLLLPPSRSLVLAKNRLRGLPGGGGTPLAQGLQLALSTAGQARGRGMTPTLALLTDGRGNVALDGSGDRPLAEAQAMQLARAARAAGMAAVVIDTGARPNPWLSDLAAAMAARYVALPRATAGRLAQVLGAALES